MKFPNRRKFLHLAAGAAALPAVTRIARAQAYPARPITMIVPFAAGGPTDVIGRVVAEGMRASLGQPIIIENVTGAGGSIGVGRVARAAPDGYTISIGQWGSHVTNGAIYALPYDLLNDFVPLAWIATGTPLIVSRNTLPAKNLRELVAWLKANPDKASQGTAGAGSPQHIAGIYFQKETATRFQFVPYRGVAPAMQDLVAGQLDFMIDQATNSLPQVNAGKIRAYAVTGRPAWPQRPIFRLWTRPVCRDFMFRSGRGFGHPIERRRTLSPNSMAPWLPLWQVRGFASGLRKSCRRFRRASSRCPRRSVRCRRRRSRSCGRSSRRPVSSRSDPSVVPNGIFDKSR
jgi:tripartite-type tricarboxylate transporter receptor subunit TctC